MSFWDNLAQNVFVTVAIFALGWLAGEVFERIFAKQKEDRLKEETRIALEAIYAAEGSLLGEGRGPERLDFACKHFMEKTKTKSYKKAQEIILHVFPLTKLSH